MQLEEVWVEQCVYIRETTKNVFINENIRASKLIQRIRVDNPLIRTGWPLLEYKIRRYIPDRIVTIDPIERGSIAMRDKRICSGVMVSQWKSVDVDRSTIDRDNMPVEQSVNSVICIRAFERMHPIMFILMIEILHENHIFMSSDPRGNV
eukprot:scaffold1152_cov65-Attheya_sp.AAC.3